MCINPASQPNRILRNKPTRVRIVVPIPVVVKPRLLIKVLPLESDGVSDAGFAGGGGSDLRTT
jgi:hypothetical protein